MPSTETSIPASIPDHELISVIGSGSYGGVWLARNALGSYRAVKIVFERDFRHRAPFEREFRGVRKFEPISRLHEGLVDVLQVGQNAPGGFFYCVMELADDVQSAQRIDPEKYSPRTLAGEIRDRKRLPVEECRQIGVALGRGLEFLHGLGLIHRDIKPSNVVFVNGIPKLADIGLVVETSEAKSYVGTEGFIPPEGPGSVRADIYSLGKLLYEISSGRDRHEYPELPTILGENEERKELIELNRIIWKACRNDPRERYRTAAEMVEDLEGLRDGRLAARQNRSRLIRQVSITASALLVVGAGFIFANGRKPHDRPSSGPFPGLVARWNAEGSPGKAGNLVSLRIPRSPSLDLGTSGGFTVEAWICPTNVVIPNPVLEWNNGSGYETHLFVQTIAGPGTLYANLVDTNGSNHAVRSAAGIMTANEFQQVVLTYDTNSGSATMYRNGTEVARTNLGSYVPYTTDDLYVGRRVASAYPNDTWTFGGAIDEVSLYYRALTPEEIKMLFGFGHGDKLATVPPP